MLKIGMSPIISYIPLLEKCPNTEFFFIRTEYGEIPVRIPSECEKIRTRKNSVFGHFSSSGILLLMLQHSSNGDKVELLRIVFS